MLHLLRGDRRGVTAVEFALVAPVFMMFMFLIIDGGRAVWTYQTLQEVASNSARCAALGLTGCKTQAEVQQRAGQELWAVFVPTSPNPTGGYVLYFPPDEITELDMSVGDGMKMVISGGAVVPPNRPAQSIKFPAAKA